MVARSKAAGADHVNAARPYGCSGDVPTLPTCSLPPTLWCCPSRWEARSLVAQEALLAGRPLIATAVGRPARAGWRRRGAGAAEQCRALDAAVRGVLADPARRAELAVRGRRQAAEWPTEATSTSQISAVYNRGPRRQAPMTLSGRDQFASAWRMCRTGPIGVGAVRELPWIRRSNSADLAGLPALGDHEPHDAALGEPREHRLVNSARITKHVFVTGGVGVVARQGVDRRAAWAVC